MKILLAGATGAVGRLLLPLLVEAGHEVIGTSRSAEKSAAIKALGGEPKVMDALNREMVFATMHDVKPDVVIHQLTDLSTRNFDANSRLRIEGTRNLVDAAQSVDVRRMIAQSISWICVPGMHPAHEDEPLDLEAPPPRGQTIAAIHSLEQCVAEMPIGIVLRYGFFYGPGTWYSRDGFVTTQIRRGEITATDAVSSFIHVEDAAYAALTALGWAAGIVNIVDDEPAMGTEWIPLYAELVNAPPPPVAKGRLDWQRGESNAKARQRDWRPRYPTWREGFKSALV